jgi:peroxiredoxin
MKMRFAGSMALGALLALASSAPAAAALAPGAVAPTFTAQASQAGKEFTFSLADALKKGPVVVYFYPSAYTGGCDLEAHTFAVNRDKFDAAGATIIGVSADSIERLDQFSADPKYCAGKFPVASDAEVKVALSYGLEAMEAHPGMKDVRGVAIDHSFIPRTTFVISSDGKIVATLSSETDHLRPDEHVKQSLAIVQRLQAAKAP